jgi:hypothetical protein
MQYSHLALQDGHIYDMFAKNEYEPTLKRIVDEGSCSHPDALFHIEQSVNYLSISDTKQKQIWDILKTVYYLEAA